MADKVFLHIGLPKTGTTYLQRVLWDNRGALLTERKLLPGRGHREHLWAALGAQGRKGLRRRHPDAPGSWGRLVAELGAWDGTGIVSHEFFCAAGSAHVARMVQQLAPAEVHVVVTARHALAMLSAGWQELVKNGGTTLPEDVGAGGVGPRSEFSWRTWDLRGVLKRWGDVIPADRMHIIALPRAGEPPEQHWKNFASTLGITSHFVLPARPANQSLGVVQVELLRRINSSLGEFSSPTDRGTWIRGRLAEQWLASLPGEPIALTPDLVVDCRDRSRRAVAMIKRRGYDVVGDLDELLVPETLPLRRTREDVSEKELISAAGDLVAVMLAEVRDSSRGLGAARRLNSPQPGGPPSAT